MDNHFLILFSTQLDIFCALFNQQQAGNSMLCSVTVFSGTLVVQIGSYSVQCSLSLCSKGPSAFIIQELSQRERTPFFLFSRLPLLLYISATSFVKYIFVTLKLIDFNGMWMMGCVKIKIVSRYLIWSLRTRNKPSIHYLIET